MKQCLIQKAKELKDFTNLESILNINKQMIYEYPQDEITTIQILIISMKYEENPVLCDKILVKLIERSNNENLYLIFKRLSFNSKEVIKIAEKYTMTPNLKHIILKKLKSQNIEIKNENQKCLLEENVIKNTLKFINSTKLRALKKSLDKNTLEKYKDFLPELNEQGIKNYYEIMKPDIFNDKIIKASEKHVSEFIRVKYFEKITNFEDILKFFKYNQFLENMSNI